MEAWQDFLRAHKVVVGALEREMLEEGGLPLAWYDVLLNLDAAPQGRLRLQTLAEAVMLSRSGLTRLVDRLTQAGHVERVPCVEDKRGVYAALTRAGKEALRKAAPGHLRGIREHFTLHLSPDDAEALRRALGKVIAAARREGAAAPP